MTMMLVLAEKPSVARDLGAVLGATQNRGGYLEGDGVRVTWAVGHLVDFPQPADIDPAWKRWAPEALPMLPASFPLVPRKGAEDQFKLVSKLLRAREVHEVVCATDAGREGELIFRYIYEASACTKPVRRLWISSLTPSAIRTGFAKLRPSSEFDALADAARSRARADWLVGMNLTRAYSLAAGELTSVGRVQTPTLAMVVARDLAIRQHCAEPYREVEGQFETAHGRVVATYVRRVFDDADGGRAKDSARLPARRSEPALSPEDDADQVVRRASVGLARVERVQATQRAVRAPQLFDLGELQRTAINRFGWSASHVLAVAQELYEKHKLISYPRTDSRYLSQDLVPTLSAIVSVVAPPYRDSLAPDAGSQRLDRRFVDDAKVTDHHAIIPTATAATGLGPASDAGRLYDVVCRRFLAAFQPDLIEAVSELEVSVTTGDLRDRYRARGKATVRAGWRLLEPAEDPSDEPAIPAGVVTGTAVTSAAARVVDKQTRPAPHFTEASLLQAMESAGASLEGELSAAMKERGLGTPATRASIVETLLARGYVERKGKLLVATTAGERLVARVHPEVRSPRMTGEWEARLRRMERGEGSAEAFGSDVAEFVTRVVTEALAGGVAPRRDVAGTALSVPVGDLRRPRAGRSRRVAASRG